MRSGIALTATLLFAAACSLSLGGELLEERTESFTVEPGGRLFIDNANGNVRVEPWDGASVEVTLSVFGNPARGIPEGFEAEASSTPTSLEYRVRYPRGTSNVSAGFLVRVPRELSLITGIELTNGNITVIGPHMVDLETSNGNITVEGAAGGPGARTTNGSITASFIGITEGLTLETVNGSVRASFPADAAFSAETVNGTVTVEGFTATTSSRTGVSIVGEPSAKIGTVNGNITVGVI